MRVLLIIMILVSTNTFAFEQLTLHGVINNVITKEGKLFVNYTIENKSAVDIDVLDKFGCPRHIMSISNIFDVTIALNDGSQEKLNYKGPHTYPVAKPDDITIKSGESITCQYWLDFGYAVETVENGYYAVKIDASIRNKKGNNVKIISDELKFRYVKGVVTKIN